MVYPKKINTAYNILALVIFVTGCSSTSVNNISTDATPPTLQANECIVITKIRTNVKQITVFMSYETEDTRLLELQNVQGPEDLRVIVIDCAPIAFSFAYYHNNTGFLIDNTLIKYKPVTGKINYFGDLVIEWGNTTIKSILVDREQKTIQQARERYPELFNRYQYHNATHPTNKEQ